MDKEGIVFALFPEIPATDRYCTCFEHVGQHGSADYSGCIANSRPATQEEYADLAAELTGRGYNLQVYQRRPN
jgi:hypothetical protein